MVLRSAAVLAGFEKLKVVARSSKHGLFKNLHLDL
jgi:hypothetical protein